MGADIGPVVRRATPADAPALVQLRVVMESTFWGDVPEGDWLKLCQEAFERRIGDPDGEFVAFVVDGPGGVPVASGVGWVNRHLPCPSNPTGRIGHIESMSTRPEYRGRGYGRAIMTELLGWFSAQRVAEVRLIAAPMGESLYRSVGFGDLPEPALEWHLPDGPLRD